MLGILFALLCATFFSLSYVLVQLGMKKSNKDNGLFINIIVNVFFLGFIYFIIFIIRKDPTVMTGAGIVAFIAAGLLTSLFGRVHYFPAFVELDLPVQLPLRTLHLYFLL